MNKRLSTLSLLWLLLASLFFTACDSGPAATPTVSTNDTPGINITQGDYDSALAKWKAKNVQEYEEVVDYSAFSLLSGTWDLHITNGKVEVKSFERGGTPETQVPGQDLFLLTVEGIFNNISRVLADVNQANQTYAFRYEVQFDASDGHPTFFSARSVPNPQTGGNVIADADYTIQIKSLNIIK